MMVLSFGSGGAAAISATEFGNVLLSTFAGGRKAQQSRQVSPGFLRDMRICSNRNN
jgi:hypothetical protein